MAPFSQDFIESVRNAGDIVRVISDYVPLKPAGSRLKGLCPFHQEKTPSFSVDPNTQLFYCFGCQTGGDIFKFVMLYDKAGFGEAVETLAKRFGVPLPRRSGKTDDLRDRLMQINEAAASFFRSLLQQDAGARCRRYLDERGIDAATADRLGLAYAPDSWEALQQHLLAKRFRKEELAKSGLFVPRKSGSGHYDRFRDRLIFPIRDIGGRMIAFGGRAIGDAEPKYINSPETPTYTKGDHLYGLDLARETIRREGYAIVVEGYLDLTALVQAGFDNVVASLGTAFTPAQARLLARYTDRVKVSYDGDAAGAKATARSLDLLLERGFEVRVVELPGGDDPDDLIRRDGADAYRALLDEAPEYLQFLLNREARRRDLDLTEQKISAVNAILPHLAKLGNAIERLSWAGRLADTLQIEEELVQQELRSALKAAQTRIQQRPQSSRPPREAGARLVSLLLDSAEEREAFAEEIDWADLEGAEVLSIVRTIVDLTRRAERVDYPAVMTALKEESDRDLLTQIAFREQPETGPTVEDCLCAFKRKRLQREGREVARELRKIQDDRTRPAEQDDVDRRLLELQQLARRRDALFQSHD
ncbi:MAG: DNA primase [Planctomycetota bacterium]